MKFYGLKRLCAVIIGSVFFVAGTLKLIDPVGAGLVVTEYFKFFHVGFMRALAEPVGVGMAFMECIVGAALITGVAKRLANAFALAMIVFFTILTAILAIFNPHMDCGCFGEAVHLSHFQTFLKNVFLLAVMLLAISPRLSEVKTKKVNTVAFSLVTVATVFLTMYSILSVPFIDFTPFGIGAELEAAQDNEGHEEDEYMATFIYEKNGQEGSFTLENLPDSTWTFVRTETYLVNGQKQNDSVAALSFTDASGEYRDDDVTYGQVMLVTSYKPEKLSDKDYMKISSFLSNASSSGFTTAFIVASDPTTMEYILSTENLDQTTRMTLMSSMYFADYKTLITVNRSNGGATRLNDGEIISKFARPALPARDKVVDMASEDPVEVMLSTRNRGRLWLQGYFLYTFAVMLLL